MMDDIIICNYMLKIELACKQHNYTDIHVHVHVLTMIHVDILYIYICVFIHV